MYSNIVYTFYRNFATAPFNLTISKVCQHVVHVTKFHITSIKINVEIKLWKMVIAGKYKPNNLSQYVKPFIA